MLFIIFYFFFYFQVTRWDWFSITCSKNMTWYGTSSSTATGSCEALVRSLVAFQGRIQDFFCRGGGGGGGNAAITRQPWKRSLSRGGGSNTFFFEVPQICLDIYIGLWGRGSYASMTDLCEDKQRQTQTGAGDYTPALKKVSE